MERKKAKTETEKMLRRLAIGADIFLNGNDDGKPKKFGFAMLVFAFGKPGMANYLSNADRPDMIKCLEASM